MEESLVKDATKPMMKGAETLHSTRNEHEQLWKTHEQMSNEEAVQRIEEFLEWMPEEGFKGASLEEVTPDAEDIRREAMAKNAGTQGGDFLKMRHIANMPRSFFQSSSKNVDGNDKTRRREPAR